MSMLAEPRRKQRISVDPQNLQWRNDQNGIGQRMLQQMGWKGGGLGKQEHGTGENVKLRANYTHRGLGAEKSGNGDQWMAHHDEFSQILARLNENKTENRVGSEGNSEERDDQKAGSNSHRISRRFVRCKNVGSLTSEQKCAIFGNAVKEKGKKRRKNSGKQSPEKEREAQKMDEKNGRDGPSEGG